MDYCSFATSAYCIVKRLTFRTKPETSALLTKESIEVHSWQGRNRFHAGISSAFTVKLDEGYGRSGRIIHSFTAQPCTTAIDFQ
jgi:hypothetical protein